MTEGAASCGALSSHARPLISLIQKAAGHNLMQIVVQPYKPGYGKHACSHVVCGPRPQESQR